MGCEMSSRDTWLLVGFGLLFWIAGTLMYRVRGPVVFESTNARYWTAFVVTPILATLICVGVLLWMHVPKANWAMAGLLISIPGMFGEALILSQLATMMPRMHVATGGRYGALLFASYGVFLAVTEVVAMRA